MLLRWAIPHKGPPSHLTGLEYGLRLLVFYPLFILTFLPTVLLGLFMIFAGPFGIAVFLAFSGFADTGSLELSNYENRMIVFCGTAWLFSLALSLFIRKRYLTSRS